MDDATADRDAARRDADALTGDLEAHEHVAYSRMLGDEASRDAELQAALDEVASLRAERDAQTARIGELRGDMLAVCDVMGMWPAGNANASELVVAINDALLARRRARILADMKSAEAER